MIPWSPAGWCRLDPEPGLVEQQRQQVPALGVLLQETLATHHQGLVQPGV